MCCRCGGRAAAGASAAAGSRRWHARPAAACAAAAAQAAVQCRGHDGVVALLACVLPLLRPGAGRQARRKHRWCPTLVRAPRRYAAGERGDTTSGAGTAPTGAGHDSKLALAARSSLFPPARMAARGRWRRHCDASRGTTPAAAGGLGRASAAMAPGRRPVSRSPWQQPLHPIQSACGRAERRGGPLPPRAASQAGWARRPPTTKRQRAQEISERSSSTKCPLAERGSGLGRSAWATATVTAVLAAHESRHPCQCLAKSICKQAPTWRRRATRGVRMENTAHRSVQEVGRYGTTRGKTRIESPCKASLETLTRPPPPPRRPRPSC